MSPEAAIASHACAHLGAVQVPIFSGFAGPAVSARLADAAAKLVVTADASYRRGRLVPMKEVLDDALADAPSVEHVVVWRRAGARLPDDCGSRRLVGRRRGGLRWIARAGRGRQRSALPPRLHVGNDGKAEGCAPRPGRLPGLDRARDRLPGRSARGRPRPLLHRHGLDHGSVDGDRRHGVRRDGRLHGGRAGLARTTASGSSSTRSA